MSTTPISYQDDPFQCFSRQFLNGTTNLLQPRQAKDEVDDILVQGINLLSFDELQREQDDLHGVAEDATERTDRVNRLLDILDDHLNEMKAGTAYASAEEINQDYVSARQLRLLFLRGNRYDPRASADQIIRFFESKLKLFGREKLVKDICLSDLDEYDVECLLTAFLVSAVKDRAGRSIIFLFPGLRSFKTLENELRACYYLFMQLCKSLDSPNRGVVCVAYGIGQFRGRLNGVGRREVSELIYTMPYRIGGIHMCFETAALAMFGKATAAMSSSRMKARIKVHCGSHTECQYILSTFGIPRTTLQQFCENTENIWDHQLLWYYDCLQRESIMTVSHLAPSEKDVIWVGRKVNGAGNDRLRSLAAQHLDWYFAGNSKERRVLIDLIMEDIRKSGGRFLTPDEHGSSLEEVPLEDVRVRINQLFRNLKKKSRCSAQKTAGPSAFSESDIVRTVDTASQDDVLFGKMHEHAGNQRLRELVESKYVEYNNSTRGKKKELADMLVKEVKRQGGRFLKPIKDGKWVEVSDKVAEMKVSCHFRNMRRK